MPLQELLDALDTLIQALNKAGKPPAAFFADRAAELRQASPGDAGVRDNLQALATCMPMAQYGDFSLEEEALLGKVVDLAGDCLKALP
ncbi:hypothetical protein RRX38_15440 [Pseudomonas sp. DTU_2021_1001937_2_SI_NGA_ILE_001]|uniref:hypothetical protein n=1 Tax=Pseudomonas sp. DTU_2021_1001937_2_SI_NGA_ILE_001 TaxID=3077589 RepID=UPI0028FC206B|nr:hypothetical protein [Pseudomonas sp. DTU_2021_1001937_2_SI_NGA_ILE_001]WNW12478.1 hypothetical protein RRX38_15440 [Pseudomonas sp. DTU_2021_1001937_2_SI_NGA_ILE_001]